MGSLLVGAFGALIAWRIPEGSRPFMPVRILGSHTDATGFTLKPRPDLVKRLEALRLKITTPTAVEPKG